MADENEIDPEEVDPADVDDPIVDQSSYRSAIHRAGAILSQKYADDPQAVEDIRRFLAIETLYDDVGLDPEIADRIATELVVADLANREVGGGDPEVAKRVNKQRENWRVLEKSSPRRRARLAALAAETGYEPIVVDAFGKRALTRVGWRAAMNLIDAQRRLDLGTDRYDHAAYRKRAWEWTSHMLRFGTGDPAITPEDLIASYCNSKAAEGLDQAAVKAVMAGTDFFETSTGKKVVIETSTVTAIGEALKDIGFSGGPIMDQVHLAKQKRTIRSRTEVVVRPSSTGIEP